MTKSAIGEQGLVMRRPPSMTSIEEGETVYKFVGIPLARRLDYSASK